MRFTHTDKNWPTHKDKTSIYEAMLFLLYSTRRNAKICTFEKLNRASINKWPNTEIEKRPLPQPRPADVDPKAPLDGSSHPSIPDRKEIAGQIACCLEFLPRQPRASTPADDGSKWAWRTDISTQVQISVPTWPEGRVEAVYTGAKVEGRKLLLAPASQIKRITLFLSTTDFSCNCGARASAWLFS